MIASVLVQSVAGASYTVLFALAFSLQLRVTKVWNFGIGGMALIGGYLSYVGIVLLGLNPYIVVAGSIAVTGAAGWVYAVGPLVMLRRQRADFFSVFVFTIMITAALEGVTELLFGSQTVIMSTGGVYQAPYLVVGISLTPWEIWAPLVATTASLGVVWLMQYSPLGHRLNAVACNPLLARVYDIPVARLFALTSAVAAALTALGVYLLGTNYNLYPQEADSIVITAVLATLLGGAGNLWGSLVGAYLVSLAEQVVSFYLPSQWGLAITYGLLFVVVISLRRGLFKEISHSREADDSWVTQPE